MIDFKKFPVTRYQGSKRKMAPWIYEHIKDIEFHSVLDACGGSGSVSYLFKKMGKQVTYNDKLRFNYLIGKAIIQNQDVQFYREDFINLINWSNQNESDGFIEDTFEGIYYLTDENQWLGRVNNGIFNMNHYVGQTLEYKKSLAYYALFQACLIKRPFNLFHRGNLNIRTADVERNFGNKVTWEKPFHELFVKFVDEVNGLVFDSGVQCHATNDSLFDIQAGEHDLVYIDPPYIAKKGASEGANYLKCYHFLEGLANYDEWEDLIDWDSPSFRFGNINEENDFAKENIISTFERMIEKFSDSKIVISYKSGGVPSVRTIVKLMEKYKGHGNVYTRSRKYSYALSHNNKNNREVLIIGL
jgi:adenine-specific DNA-methyltransferase